MRLPMMALAGLALLAGCGKAGSAQVEDAWIRLPAVPGRPGAAYFRLHTAADPKILLTVRTPAAVRSELHESMKTGAGGMSMRALDKVAVPAAGSVAFAPGGRHVMLFDVAPDLKPGATAKLTLAFADGTTMTTDARVVAAGDPAPAP